MSVNVTAYTSLITSEHNVWPNFMALVAYICQASVDQQNLVDTFPDLFDVDEAVGDQEDKLGLWIGVSRNLNQAIDVPTAEDNFQRADGGLGPNWSPSSGSMGIVSDAAEATSGGWAGSYWTQEAVDNFTRANENPLNPAAWSVAPTLPGFSPFGPLQIKSDECISTDLSVDCFEIYTGISFGPDQLSEITLGNVANGGSVGCYVRASAAGFYIVEVNGPLGAGVVINLSVATPTFENPLGTFTGTVNVNDIVSLGVIGNVITVLLNGTPIIGATDSTITDGSPGIFCIPAVVVTDSAIKKFDSGPAIFSNDQFAKSYITNGSALGPAVRMTAGGNFYVLFPSGGDLVIAKVVAGTETDLASVAYTPIIGDLLTLEIQGTTLTGKVNGKVFLSVMDSMFATGTPGIAANNGTPSTNASTGWFGGSLPGVSVLDDDDYRILLKLFIAMNYWDGTVPGIYTIWNTVFATEGYQILIGDNQDMTMDVVFLNPPNAIVILALFTQGYFLLRPAGVRITGFYEPSISGPIFGFDVESSVISGWDVGAWMIPIEI